MILLGTLLRPIRRDVAMKFTKLSDAFKAKMEYEIYTCLNAINDPDVERYGIPAVYYYGKWEDYILMAITLLDSKFNPNPKSSAINEVDVLILFREIVIMVKMQPINSQPLKRFSFIVIYNLQVRISKYIHYYGVRHNDLKVDNMMFRGHQGFIIGKLRR